MSELKTYKMVDEKYCTDCVCVIPSEVYLKSEADKVIAELEKKLDLYKRGWEENDKVNAYLYAELRHQKYKRCLDNAWWCRKSSKAYAWSASNLRGWKIALYYDKKAELYRMWHKRWLELAEKFKEAK